MTLSRRRFVQQSAAVAAGFAGLRAFVLAGPASAAAAGARGSTRFGPLVPDPRGVFDLPEGFSYRVIARFGATMDDGFLVPHRADGMATFPGPDGRTILVINHEVSPGRSADESAFGPDARLAGRLDPGDFFDAGRAGIPAGGGTTTLVYDTERREVVRHFLSLAGTLRNCAGGPTPWGSWLTCEEIVTGPDEWLARSHGWVFEVPATPEPGLAPPIPIRGMGRFNHEAVAVDETSGAIYLTEDEHDGLLYRFLPDRPGALREGGRLQALGVRGRPGLDTRNWYDAIVGRGEPLEVEWLHLDDVESPRADLRFRGLTRGAARFARGEGMWYGNDAVYFACTNDGPARLGQIWRYLPSPSEGTDGEWGDPGRLELFLESDGPSVLENADNLTVSPWGDLIVCEDGSDVQHLIGVMPDGATYVFGRNALDTSELAGATFSPDGSTLFVNIQHAGLTLAIHGPWDRGEGL